jgi:hypothetical protein
LGPLLKEPKGRRAFFVLIAPNPLKISITKNKRKQKKAVLLSSIFAYFRLFALICAGLGSAGPSAREIMTSAFFLKLRIDELREQA